MNVILIKHTAPFSLQWFCSESRCVSPACPASATKSRNVDEPGYLDCSLCLIEGIVPGYKAAPGGAQLWEGWFYAAVQSAKNLLHPHAEAVGKDLRLRPFIALNQALFDDYRDISSMRYFILALNLIFGAAAIWAASRFGFSGGGVAGRDSRRRLDGRPSALRRIHLHVAPIRAGVVLHDHGQLRRGD